MTRTTPSSTSTSLTLRRRHMRCYHTIVWLPFVWNHRASSLQQQQHHRLQHSPANHHRHRHHHHQQQQQQQQRQLSQPFKISAASFPPAVVDRRHAIAACWIGSIFPWVALADDELASEVVLTPLERRDRSNNQDALIREDYWYMTGRIPPRKLQSSEVTRDDPQWNAFGSCITNAEGSASNSCTYVPLKQRIPTYSKYAFNVALGAKDYQQLGNLLRRQLQLQPQQLRQRQVNESMLDWEIHPKQGQPRMMYLTRP